MRWMDMFEDLADGNEKILEALHGNAVCEIRMRSGKPLRIRCIDGREISGNCVQANQLRLTVNRLMENSLYACERELKAGYFTAAGGLRVGVCGKVSMGNQGVESLANIGSACIRIPREKQGCAKEIFEQIMENGPSSLLLLSPPGMGKTTMIRDLARLAAETGYDVAIADERREIAACLEGVPQLDVGSRTDVMDACPKDKAISMLVRACAPDLIVVDEIGGTGDAQAIEDAVRCGVAVIATAHASSLSDACSRRQLMPLIKKGVFDWYGVLGPVIGRIKTMRRRADVRLDDD